jgi:hypothetical protein
VDVVAEAGAAATLPIISSAAPVPTRRLRNIVNPPFRLGLGASAAPQVRRSFGQSVLPWPTQTQPDKTPKAGTNRTDLAA